MGSSTPTSRIISCAFLGIVHGDMESEWIVFNTSVVETVL